MDDEKAAKVGVVECVRGGVLRQYEPAGEADNSPVSRLLTTIGMSLSLSFSLLVFPNNSPTAITKNGISRLAAASELDLSRFKSDKKIEDEEILKILERPLARSTGSKNKKNKKKTAGKKADEE